MNKVIDVISARFTIRNALQANLLSSRLSFLNMICGNRTNVKVHSLSSNKVEMYLCAACHAFVLNVNAWKNLIEIVVQV